MEEYAGILVSDPSLQSEFTQAELRAVKAQFTTLLNKNGRKLIAENLPFEMLNLNDFKVSLTENEVATLVRKQYRHSDDIVDFEGFLRVYLSLQTQTHVNSMFSKNNSAFLKSGITTFLHTISESEKAAYVSHINRYLANDPEIERFLPIDPTTDDLFDMVKDGILLCKLINVAVPGTIDERAINTREKLNPWEMNENHTLCLNSAKAIGCTVVNIGSQDLIEGRPYLVLGLVSQIIKIQLLADLNLKKTPELVELAEDAKDVENLMNLSPEKILLKWMNFHLQKAGYSKTVSNFSSDIKDGEAYAVLLNVLAPEHCSPVNLTNDPMERAKLVISQAEKMNCRSYVSPQDIVEGSSNLNMAFVAHLFNQRKGLSLDTNKLSFAGIVEDDIDSREEKTFRLWINSLYIDTYVNNISEDLRSGWVLLEVLDKVSPGSVNWKHANQPPIKMPFRKVENCNQAVKIGKQLKLSLVNVSGNDIVQGNKKLILAFLWQLMRHNMLQLVKSLKRYSNNKDISDVNIMKWANAKIEVAGRNSRIESFRDKSLSNGIFFLELLSAVEPRAVNWYIVTKGETEEQKRLNATYVISVARKLGCSLFLLPEDIVEVNPKMLLTLTASIMHWCLTTQRGEDSSVISDCETGSVNGSLSNLAIDDSTSEASSLFDNGSE